MSLRLYQFAASHYNEKARWGLDLKRAPHERVTLLPGPHAPTMMRLTGRTETPALVDGDIVVTEAAAICAYLADRFPERGLAPEPGSRERGAYYRYLFVPGTTLEPVFSLAALGFEHPAPQSAGWGDVTRALATIEAMVPENGWALGERFTAADIVVFVRLISDVGRCARACVVGVQTSGLIHPCHPSIHPSVVPSRGSESTANARSSLALYRF